MNVRTLTGYLAIGALMVALPLSAAVSTTIGTAGGLATATVVASMIMPESQTGSLEYVIGADKPAAASEGAVQDPDAGRRIQADWVAAHPELYARIALAFDTEALDGADLVGVECRTSVCKVSFEADADIPVRSLLPMQLAQSFHAMVTVHAGGSDHVYVDVP